MLFRGRYWILQVKQIIGKCTRNRKLVRLLSVSLLLIMVLFESIPPASVQANSANQSDLSCSHITFSSDGNPFPLCPGTYPQGGNCTWWSWEQWHMLGYDLPDNWGNAADWIVNAEHAGLSVGTMPRVGAIAVFPRGDGVWAANSAGHVAFVVGVSTDNQSFTVTYQNYGDSTFMHVGKDYRISAINQPQFQNGELRFIYFPHPVGQQLFAELPGVIALGLAPLLTNQEFNADFTGQGTNNLLLYNRQQGSIDLFRFDTNPAQAAQRVGLGDSITPVGQWGSSLDIHVGDFAGTGHDDILLHDRNTGSMQLISLNPDLTIQQHAVLSNIGTGWEIYVGRLDGKRDSIFLYKRFGFASTDVSTTPTSTSTPKPQPTPTPKPVAPPTPTATPTPKPTATPTPMPAATPTPTAPPTPTPKPASTSAPTATPTPTSTATAATTASVSNAAFFSPVALSAHLRRVNPPATTGGSDLSITAPQDRDKKGNIRIIDFNQDLSIAHQQWYSLLDGSWEVYVGRFVNAQQDGIFLYDRSLGDARLMDFNDQLLVNDYQQVHNLKGDWQFYSGDFANAGRAQIFLYDPLTGKAQMLSFDAHLALQDHQSYSDLGANLMVYVGRFGLAPASLMFYDPAHTQSMFIGFDQALDVAHQYLVNSWDKSRQLLVGSFQDHTQCDAAGTCSQDNILVLNRQNGQIERYAFSFGRQFQVYDNRIQGLLREGDTTAGGHVISVDGSTFELVGTVGTGIREEEVY